MESRHQNAQAIIDIARELFGTQGYNNTSMSQIAKAAGMSKAGVYHHFASKCALLKALVAQMCAHLETHVLSEVATDEGALNYNEALRALLDRVSLKAQSKTGGSELVKIAMSCDESQQDVQQDIQHALGQWPSYLEKLLQLRYKGSELAQQARSLFVRIYGAMIMSDILQDTTLLHRELDLIYQQFSLRDPA